MSNQRNYTDSALERYVEDLGEGEQKLLVLAGALPETFRQLQPQLSSEDVAQMIEIAQAD
jgi:hypothetical protein